MRDLQNEVLAATVAKFGEAIEKAHNLLLAAPELNMSNYTEDQVAELNHAVNEACCILEAVKEH